MTSNYLVIPQKNGFTVKLKKEQLTENWTFSISDGRFIIDSKDSNLDRIKSVLGELVDKAEIV